jgi:hypothetical protein
VIGGRRPLQGQKPGDRRVRIERPHAVLFRWTGPGQLTGKEAASIPATPDPITIIVLPEFVARHWWDRLLYNQSAKRLKSALVGREHTVIADVPYRRGP